MPVEELDAEDRWACTEAERQQPLEKARWKHSVGAAWRAVSDTRIDHLKIETAWVEVV